MRAGWSLGTQDRYLKYEAASDSFVGRTVSGLTLLEETFAVLPPHVFLMSSNISKAIDICYPGSSGTTTGVAANLLASVVYHAECIKRNLPKTHPIFSTPLFTHRSMINDLLPLIQCRVVVAEDRLRATDIPAHISILVRLRHLETALGSLQPAIQATVPAIVGQVNQLL